MAKGPEQAEQGGAAERERLPYALLGKVSIMRHGQTEYTNTYPDITELGQQQVKDNARKIKESINPNEEITLVSSPTMRARGSADILKNELGISDIQISKKLRSSAVREWDAGNVLFHEITGMRTEEDENFRMWDRFITHHPAANERIDLWEPRSRAEQRSLRGLKYIIEVFKKYKAVNPDKTPHLVSVSHIEFLNHFVEKVFQISEDDPLRFGEMIEMTILEKQGDVRYIPIGVTFRGMTKKIIFDSRTRTIETIKESNEAK